MIRQMKAVLYRSQDTVLQDAAGVTALVVMLFVGLCLPVGF